MPFKYVPAAHVNCLATHSSTTLVAPAVPVCCQPVVLLVAVWAYPVLQLKYAVGLFCDAFLKVHVPWPPVTVHVG